MASVKDTLLWMMVTYPRQYPTTSECHNQLFLTNGCGYSWVDGQLCDLRDTAANEIIPRFLNEEEELEKSEEEWGDLVDALGPRILDHVRLRVRRHNNQLQFTLDNIDLLLADNVAFHHGVHYDGKGYCQLTQLPYDIDDDWREAVLTCIHAAQVYCNQEIALKGSGKSIKIFQADIKKLFKDRFPKEFGNKLELSRSLKDLVKKA